MDTAPGGGLDGPAALSDPEAGGPPFPPADRDQHEPAIDGDPASSSSQQPSLLGAADAGLPEAMVDQHNPPLDAGASPHYPPPFPSTSSTNPALGGGIIFGPGGGGGGPPPNASGGQLSNGASALLFAPPPLGSTTTIPLPAHNYPPPFYRGPTPPPNSSYPQYSSHHPQQYERLLERVAELEQDLSQTMAANARLCGDVENLRSIHRELGAAYTRLKTQHTSAKQQLHEEKHRSAKVEEEYRATLAEWREKLLGKARELEELQQIPDPAREIEMIRLKVAEEVAAPFEEKLETAERRAELETRKLNDAKRQIEVLRLELEQKNKDVLLFEKDTAQRLAAQRELYQTKIASLQTDLDKNQGLASTTTSLRQQVYDRAAKNKSLMHEMDDMAARFKEEIEKLRKEVAQRSADAQQSSKISRDLEIGLEKAKRDAEVLRIRSYELEAGLERAKADSQSYTALQLTEREVEKDNSELSSRLQSLEHSRERREQELILKEQELVRLREEKKQLAAQNAELEADSSQGIAEVELRLTGDVEATKVLLESTRRRLEGKIQERGLTSSVDGVLSRPTRKTPLVPSGADLDHVRQQLRDQESSHTAECTAYESKLEALTADGTQLRHQRDMEKERAKENERKALEYDGLFGQYRELQNSHGDATSSKDALQSDLAATRAENRTLVSKLEELHKSHMEWRSRVENDQEKQLVSIRGTLSSAQQQVSVKDKELKRTEQERRQLATSTKKKLETQKAKTKLLLNRYAEVANEKEQAVRIAENNKKKYEMQMLQVHKLLNDPNFQQTQPGVDKNVGIFKEIQAIRDCLDEAIYQGKQ